MLFRSGSLLCTIQTLNYRPQMATVRPRVMSMPAQQPERSGRVVEAPVELVEDDIIAKLLSYIPDDATDQAQLAYADVIVAGRNPAKLDDAISALSASAKVPAAGIGKLRIDTSSIESSTKAAAEITGRGIELDGLILNAGLVHGPKTRTVTPEGHELFFATNILGHFAFVGSILDSLTGAAPHIVWLGSSTAIKGEYSFTDPELADAAAEYKPMKVYAHSKAATTMVGAEAARRFAKERIIPVAAECDRVSEFPKDVFKAAWEIGLVNPCIPDEYGGSGMGELENALITEQLAYGCAGIQTSITANTLGLTPIKLAGSEEQKKKYFGWLMSEPTWVSYATTEPGAGSDLQAIRTRAVRDGDHYRLSGAKTFISNGQLCDLCIVAAKTDLDPKNAHKGISLFVVEADRSRRGSLKTALRRLRAMRPVMLGAVLTKFDPLKGSARYSAYYGYEYYQYEHTERD